MSDFSSLIYGARFRLAMILTCPIADILTIMHPGPPGWLLVLLFKWGLPVHPL